MWDLLLGGVLGAAGGSKLGQLMSGNQKQPDIGQQITDLVNNMNNTILQYGGKAIATNDLNTGNAVNAQNQYLQSAISGLNSSVDKATLSSQLQSLLGYRQAQAQNAPTISAGNVARDQWMDTLGLSRPQAGSDAIYNQGVKASDNALSNYIYNSHAPQNNVGPAVSNPGAAPVRQTYNAADGSHAAEIQAQLQGNRDGGGLVNGMMYSPGTLSPFYKYLMEQVGSSNYQGLMNGRSGGSVAASNDIIKNSAMNYLNQLNQAPLDATYNQAAAAYNPKKQAFDAYTTASNQYNTQAQQYQQMMSMLGITGGQQ